MTKEESEKYIKSKMCNNCGVYLGGGNCSNNCNVIEAIQVLQEPKWIHVSERLPEDGTYLVTKRIIEPTVQIKSFAEDLYKVDEFDFYDKKGQCGWYDYDSEAGYWENTGVIAWMPLPEPYKAEGENKE